MSIVRDDCDERQTRVDRMVEELRGAGSRRLAEVATVNGGDRVVELRRDARALATVTGSTASD